MNYLIVFQYFLSFFSQRKQCFFLMILDGVDIKYYSVRSFVRKATTLLVHFAAQKTIVAHCNEHHSTIAPNSR